MELTFPLGALLIRFDPSPRPVQLQGVKSFALDQDLQDLCTKWRKNGH